MKNVFSNFIPCETIICDDKDPRDKHDKEYCAKI